METAAITKLTRIKTDVITLIMTCAPLNDYEIDVYGILVTVHQKLNTIKMDKLGQMPLPEEKEPEGQQVTMDEALKNTPPPTVECPTCKGAKTVKDGEDNDALCPTCNGAGSVPKPDSVLEEAKKILEHGKNPEKEDKPKPKVVVTEPIILDDGFLEVILGVNSNQSLREKPPRILGMFDIPNREDLAGKTFVCTGTVWGLEQKDIAALGYEIVPADKYTGVPRNLITTDEESFTGLKFTYKDIDYVITGTEYQFCKEVPEKAGKPIKPPRKTGRKSNAEKKERTRAVVDNKLE